MAAILGLITVNGKNVLEVDAIPSAGAGTAAPIGSIAMFDTGSAGFSYIKIGAADIAWDKVQTAGDSSAGFGVQLRLGVYDVAGTSNHIDDTVLQNAQVIDVAIEAQPSRSVGIEYRIPNPGDAVAAADFVLTQGAQTIYGNKTFGDNVVVTGDLSVNGNLTYINSTQTQITDKLLTLNKSGAAASAGGAGLEFEENAVITGYLKVAADRAGYEFLSPAGAFKNNLNLSVLTADRVQKFADTSGTFVMRPDGSPGVASQVPFWSDANNLASAASFTFAAGILTALNITVSSLGLGVVHSSAGGVLSSSQVSLTVDVSGVLPVANGGTNSGTALVNNRLVYSSGSAVVEYGALQPEQLYFGAATTGLPAQHANLYAQSGALWTSLLTTTGTTGISVLGGGGINLITADANAQASSATAPVVQTTGNALTTAATIPANQGWGAVLEVRVTGSRVSGDGAAGDGATFVRTARVKNAAGTAVLGPVQTDYTSQDVTGWNASLAVSGGNVLVQVTGAAATTINWFVSYVKSDVKYT